MKLNKKKLCKCIVFSQQTVVVAAAVVGAE
jgi:hypothetical protein